MAGSTASKNRKLRQDSLREFLSVKCTVQHVIDNIEKIERLELKDNGEEGQEVDYKELQHLQFQMKKLQTANDQRLKLVNKYLPDLKMQEIEHSGQIEQPIGKVQIEVLSANTENQSD